MNLEKKGFLYYLVMFLFYLIPSAFLSVLFIGGSYFLFLLLFSYSVTRASYYLVISFIILGTVLLSLVMLKKLFDANKEIEQSPRKDEDFLE